MSFAKIAIIVTAILTISVVGLIFAASNSASRSDWETQENTIADASEGKHLSLELREDVNVESNP